MTLVPVLIDVLQFCAIYVFVFRMGYSPVEPLDSSIDPGPSLKCPPVLCNLCVCVQDLLQSVESLDSSMTLVPVLMDVLQCCIIYGLMFRMCYSPVESLDSSMTLVSGVTRQDLIPSRQVWGRFRKSSLKEILTPF